MKRRVRTCRVHACRVLSCPMWALSLALSLLLATRTLDAQDRRTVTEPRVPEACVTLSAALSSAHGNLDAAEEQRLDTVRIQQAIDHCARGKAVVLAADGAQNAFLSGPLSLRAGVTLIVGQGVTLYASRDAALFSTGASTCGVVTSENQHSCRPLIAVSDAPDAAILGPGAIDGRGGDKLLGRDASWWQLAEQARSGGYQQAFRLIVADHSDNFTLYNLTLRNSPNFHVTYGHGTGFTAWGVHIDTPQRGARNTDGIDPGNGASDVTITRCWIRTGDDNVAIKGGGQGAHWMTVSDSHFYWGHGMSIGSETDGGVDHILIKNLSLDGPDNGIRIKSNGSRGGLTEQVLYDDVCVRNSANPIMLDTAYSAAGTLKGEKAPSMRTVRLHDVRVSGGGRITFNGYDSTHRIAATLDGVQITDEASYKYVLAHSDLTLGPEPSNLQLPAGEDATVSGKAARGKAASCGALFAGFE